MLEYKVYQSILTLSRAIKRMVRQAVAPDAHSGVARRPALDFGRLEDRILMSATPLGAEAAVNTTTGGTQHHPAVATDADGDFVAMWASDGQDGSGWGIYGQLFHADGSKNGGEFRIHSTTAGDQLDADVAMDADGDFVVTWSGNGPGDVGGVFAQRFNSSGVAQGGEFRVNAFTSNIQDAPSVAMDDAGNFVIVWESLDQEGTSWEVYGRRFAADGTALGGEFRINSFTVGEQQRPDVALDADGEFVVVWESLGQDGDGWGVYGKRFDSSGVAQGAEFRINSTTLKDQQSPTVGIDADGNFAVAWQSLDQDGASWGIYGRRFAADGTALGGEFRVNTMSVQSQDSPALSMDASGRFVIAWESFDQDGAGEGVYAQVYHRSGYRVGGEFLINSTISGHQAYPTLGLSDNGTMAVAWSGNGATDSAGVYLQRFSIGGASLWLSTEGDIGSSGSPGLDTWGEGEILDFNGSAYEPGTTAGRFSSIFNLDAFASDGNADVDGLHYVSRNVTVGGGLNTFDLLTGDVLFTTADNETVNGSNASLAIDDEDVVVFRPDTPGDYRSGKVYLLLDGMTAITGGNDLWSLSLVERDTVVGDVTLTAGSFLFSRDGGAEDNDVRWFTPTGVGAGTTTGAARVLIEGDQMGIGPKIYGIELIEETTALGNTTLSAGMILLSIDANDGSVGSNSISVSENDIFYITPTQTTLGSGTAVANAAVLMQGADVGLSGGSETPDAIALFLLPNEAPVNTVPGAQVTDEDVPLTFSTATANRISIYDPDAGTNPVRVTLTASGGAITLNSTIGLAFTTGDGTVDTTMVFSGTIADINAALDGLIFAPGANFHGAASLEIATNDLGYSGVGGPMADTDVVGITINPVNDAPVNTVPGLQATDTNVPLVFSSANGNAITIADLDTTTELLEVTLTATNGALTLSGTSGLTFSSGDGTADAAMTCTGTKAAINAALNGLAFNPAAGYSGAAQVQITTNDQGNVGAGGALSDSDAVNIRVGALLFQQGLDGYAGTEDTGLHSGSPDTSFGNATSVRVDLVNDGQEEGLIRFDTLFGSGPNQIPYGSTINSATLTLYAVEGSVAGAQVTLHRMLVDWTEASTWNSLADGIQADGAEAAAAADSTLADPTGTGFQSFTGLAAALQAWSDGQANYGWAILINSADGWEFASSEHGTANWRPYLTVDFAPPVPPVMDLDADNSSGQSGSDFAATFIEGGGPIAVADADAILTDSDSAAVQSLTVAIANPLDGAAESLWADTTGTGITATYDAATATLTLSGADSAANYQQVLRTIRYENASQDPDTTSRTITFVADDGIQTSSTATATIGVTAVNDTPMLDLDADDSSGEPGNDFAASFTEGLGAVRLTDTDATLADVDSLTFDSLTVTITNPLDGAAESLFANTAGTSITANYDSASSTLVLSGTDSVANYEQVLRTIRYNNASHHPSTTARTITFTANDGTADSNVGTTTLAIAAVNDAPTLDLDANDSSGQPGGDFGTSWTEDGGAVLVADADAVLSDFDNGTLQSLVVRITNLLDGTAESLSADTSGTAITAAYDSATGILTLSGADSIANYQQVLRKVAYNNTSQNPNTIARAITFTASDGTAQSNVGTATVSISAINDAPVLDLDANNSSGQPGANFAANWTEDGGAVLAADADAVLSDVDNNTLQSLVVRMTNVLDGAAESLSADTSGTAITAAYDSATGILTLSGADSLANYQQVLRTVRYDNTSQNPNTTARAITFTANDGTTNSNVGTATVSMIAVNDAPVLDLDINNSSGQPGADFATNWIEDIGGVLVADADAVLSDVDNSTLQSLVVRIVNLMFGAESLSADTSGTAITALYNNGTGVLTLSGADSVANYQQVLRTVRYDNTSDNPDTTARLITFTASDGTTNSNVGSTTVSIAAVNDAPVLDLDADNSSGQPGADFVTNWTEDGGAVLVADADAVLSDVDSNTLQSLVVRITNLLDGAAESLSANVSGTAVTAAYDSATGILTLSGADSLANYQQVLRTVRYDNTSQNPNTTARAITFTANDGTADGNLGTTTVSITALNDTPILDLDADDSSGRPGAEFTTNWTEDGGAVLVADADAVLSDVDNNTLQSLVVRITNLLDGAAESLSVDTSGTAITAAYDSATGILTLSGADSLANYQQVLRTVRYDNTSQNPNTTARAITFTANDGTADSNQGTTTVSITALNDAPILDLDADDSSGGPGAKFTTNWTEDGGAVLVADADAVLSDVDNSTLQSLTVRIANLPDGAAESLTADTSGTAITAVYDNATGVLTLSGADNVANYQQVLRTVAYNNASQNPNTTARAITFTASDGISESNLGAATVTIAAVNDAPVTGESSFLTNQTNSLTIRTADLISSATDAEGDPLHAVIVSQPSHGTLTLNSDGTYTYRSVPGFLGVDQFQYAVTDGALQSVPALVSIVVERAPLPPITPPSQGDSSSQDSQSDSQDDSSEQDELPAWLGPDPDGDDGQPGARRPLRGTNRAADAAPASGEGEQEPTGQELPFQGSDTGFGDGIIILGGASGTESRGEEEIDEDDRDAQPSGLPAIPVKVTGSGDDLAGRHPLLEQLNALSDQLDQEADKVALTVVAAAGLSTAVSVGYVIWAARASYLAASLMASMPAWTIADPLPILSFAEVKQREERRPQDGPATTDDDALESLFSHGTGK